MRTAAWLMLLPALACAQNGIEIQYVTSSVSFEQGAPVAGGLTTLFVQGLQFEGASLTPGNPPVFELAGVRVNIYGRPAAILSMQNLDDCQAISVQVSWSADDSVKPAVEVTQDNRKGVVETVPLGIWDAIITDDLGNALAYRLPGYEQITPEKPLKGGESFVIFAANMGPVTLAPPDGAVTPSNPPELIMYQREPPYNSVGSGLWIKGNDTNDANTGLADGLTGKKPMVPGLVGVYEMEFRFDSTSPPQGDFGTIGVWRGKCVAEFNRPPPFCLAGPTRYSKRVPIPVEPCSPTGTLCQPR
jgi:uncharacterized protein (TIGR03437 family)